MNGKNHVMKVGMMLAVFTMVSFSSLQAGELKYSYVEGRYILDHEFDDAEGDNGFRFGGSYQLTNSLFAIGRYDTLDFDDGDLTFLEVGAGYIHPLNDTWDANATFSIMNGDWDPNRGKGEDDTGFSFSGGVRGMVMPQVEAQGKLTYLNVDLGGKDDDGIYFTLAGDYFILPNLAAGLEISLGDIENISIGARFFFD